MLKVCIGEKKTDRAAIVSVGLWHAFDGGSREDCSWRTWLIQNCCNLRSEVVSSLCLCLSLSLSLFLYSVSLSLCLYLCLSVCLSLSLASLTVCIWYKSLFGLVIQVLARGTTTGNLDTSWTGLMYQKISCEGIFLVYSDTRSLSVSVSATLYLLSQLSCFGTVVLINKVFEFVFVFFFVIPCGDLHTFLMNCNSQWSFIFST